MSLVPIGRIGRAHGLHGEVRLEGTSLSADELRRVGSFIWKGPRGETIPVTLHAARAAHACVLVSFSGYGDRDRAATLVRGELWVESERLPDPGPETAYAFQLLGLEVRAEDGRRLGTVAEIISTAAHPVYVVRGDREWLVPAAPDVVRQVNLASGVITVALPLGLEDV